VVQELRVFSGSSQQRGKGEASFWKNRDILWICMGSDTTATEEWRDKELDKKNGVCNQKFISGSWVLGQMLHG